MWWKWLGRTCLFCGEICLLYCTTSIADGMTMIPNYNVPVSPDSRASHQINIRPRGVSAPPPAIPPWDRSSSTAKQATSDDVTRHNL